MAVTTLRYAQFGNTGAVRTISVSGSTAGVDAIIVFAAVTNSLGDAFITSVTWDPTGTPLAFTKLGTGGILDLWYLLGPPSAVNTVEVAYSGSGDIAAIAAVTLAAGVNQTTAFGTAQTFTGVTAAPSVIISSVQRNDFVIAGLVTQQAIGGPPIVTILAGEKKWEATIGPNADGFTLKLCGSHQPGLNNGSRIASWSLSSARSCNVIGASILPSPFYRASAPDHVSSPDHIRDPARFHASAPDYIADPN